VAETADADGAEPLEAPATATEQQVVALWADVLKIPPACIGRTSRFTELGGTSLSAIRLAIALDRAVTVKELAHTPTVAEVAALLDRKVAGASQEGDGIA
jgi:acyl carrier protein